MAVDRYISKLSRQLQPALFRSLPTLRLRRPLSIPPRSCPLQLRQIDRSLFAGATRQISSAASVSPLVSETDTPTSTSERPPAYELTFTCKPCKHRSTHTVSKQGYHKGTVLITCPGCNNRHVMSDHLKIFADQDFTVEDLMRQNGELVKRGHLGEGDVEFWDDGTRSERSKL